MTRTRSAFVHASAMPIDARSLELAAYELTSPAVRVIGWGAGSVFSYFHELHPIHLEYLVDGDATRWGHARGGFDILPPDQLRQEAGDTFVIIYSSAWPDIQRKVQEYGIASLPASAVFSDATQRARLAGADVLSSQPLAPRAVQPGNAVVIEGPIVPDVTSRVLRIMRALHPHDLLVLSTWNDASSEALHEVSGIVDEIVLNVRPDNPGLQNRNLQIVSTRAGIGRARECGARWVLMTRTDLAVMGRSLFAQARWWLDRVGSGDAQRAGLRDRLIVPANFTRKFLLYHPSNLVMLGTADDMLRYWAAPLDPRTESPLASGLAPRSLCEVSLDGHPAESYLGVQLCRSLGRPVEGTVDDSWAFYRDLFAVVDNDWFDLLWFKNLAFPDVATRTGARQLVSQAFWQRLHAAAGDLQCDLAEVDPAVVTVRDLAGTLR